MITGSRRPPLVERLPEPLRALARAASWHRRLLAAGCAALGVMFALSTLAPKPSPVVSVLAAARDLPGGATLTAADVRTVGLPPDVVPAGVLPSGADVVGRIVSAPIRRGEALTDVRLVGSALIDALGRDGLVAAPVRIADAGAARLLRSGDRVDVIATSTKEGSVAPVVAAGVRVLTVPDPAESTSGLDEGALVVLATTPATAAALARSAVDARLTVTIRAD